MSYLNGKTIIWICDKYYDEHIKAINYLKFSVRISLFLNSFPQNQKEIQKMKFKIEQIMRSNYSDIQDSQLVFKKKLKDDEFIVTKTKSKSNAQVYYYYRCLEFF